MKRANLLLILLWTLSAHAQTKPTMLMEPAGWQFEQFPLPPGFAPGIPYKGIEELRFSPGMFKKEATDYFTYAFVARLDGVANVSQNEIQQYLQTYFKGLCSKTAADRKLAPIDTSAIRVDIDGNNLVVHLFGVFADGAPVTLNMEVKELRDTPHQKVYLLFIASPQPKTNAVWQDLYKVQKDFTIPNG